jgi:hypothetical protein
MLLPPPDRRLTEGCSDLPQSADDLSFGKGGSLDILAVAPAALHASHFQIG